jgi:hypothetical protein
MYLDYKKKRKDDSQWGLILFKVHPSKIGFKLDSPIIPSPLDANKKKTFQNAT